MMLRSRLTRVFPQLFCRTLSVSRVVEKEPVFSSIASSESSSSAGESCSETEGEEAFHQVHQIQVLRAYLRNRRARCLGRVREQGLVPAVIVDPDKERRPKDGSTDVFISLDAKPLVSILKLIGKRDFVSRIFDMEIYRGPSSSQLQESLQVLPRNLNYGTGKTNILNIQFIRAPPGQDLKLGVPLEFLGIDQCPGLRKGGTLKKLAKYVVYNCKASELPAKIVVDMTVLEIGDRVLLQDLEVDFNRLHSDRTMPVCEIVKDVSSLKAKARRLKNELHFKRRALTEKESSGQAHSLSDDEIDVGDDGEDEVIPYRYQKQRLAQKGATAKKASTGIGSAESHEETSTRTRTGAERENAKSRRSVELRKGIKPSKRRLTGKAFVKGKLDEQAEQHNVSPSMKKRKVSRVSEDEDDEELPGLTKKQASVKGRVVSEGGNGRKGQRGQQAVALGSKKQEVYGNSDSGDEDGAQQSYARKRTAPKPMASKIHTDFDDDDEAISTSYSSKAVVRSRALGFKGLKEQRHLTSSSKKNKVFSDSDSEDEGTPLPRYREEQIGKPKAHRRALGA